MRMSRITGRSDDMLIIRGVNVFPSQVESVILELEEFEPHYMLIVDRKNNLDTLEVQVEVREQFYSDEINRMMELKKKIGHRLQSVLGIAANIKLVEPRSIERSQGKAKLGEEGVNLSAFSMAETADFGILRVIVSDPDKALEALKKHHFGVSLTDVVCLNCPNTPGALAKALGYLSDENVFIEYMYAFAAGDVAHVVIRPDNIENCIRVLTEHRLELMAAHQLYKL